MDLSTIRMASVEPTLEVQSVSKCSFNGSGTKNLLEGSLTVAVYTGCGKATGSIIDEQGAVGGSAVLEILDGPPARVITHYVHDLVAVDFLDGHSASISVAVVGFVANSYMSIVRVRVPPELSVDLGRIVGQTACAGVEEGWVAKGADTRIGWGEVAMDDDSASRKPESGDDIDDDNAKVLHCVDVRRVVGGKDGQFLNGGMFTNEKE